MAGNWIEFEQRSHAGDDGDYVSLNGKGEFMMNRFLFEKLERPEAVTLHFDPDSNRIGMRKADTSLVNAVRVRKRRAGAHAVRSRAFIRKWDIRLNGTYFFPDLQIEDEMLVLPLNTRFNVSNKGR